MGNDTPPVLPWFMVVFVLLIDVRNNCSSIGMLCAVSDAMLFEVVVPPDPPWHDCQPIYTPAFVSAPLEFLVRSKVKNSWFWIVEKAMLFTLSPAHMANCKRAVSPEKYELYALALAVVLSICTRLMRVPVILPVPLLPVPTVIQIAGLDAAVADEPHSNLMNMVMPDNVALEYNLNPATVLA